MSAKAPRDPDGPPPGEGDPAKAAQVQAMFDAIAPRYDLLNRLLSLGVDRRWRAEALALAVRARPKDVLDVATGTGDLAIALSSALPEAEVLGVDFAAGMLEVARHKAAAAGNRLRFEEADGSALPYADGSFDLVTIAYGLRNFADIDGGLREFRRVLRSGGMLLVLEFPPPPDGVFGRLFRFYFRRVVPWLGGVVSGRPSAYAYLPASVAAFPAPEALADRMRQAGFDHVHHRMQTFGVSALHRGEVP